MTNKKIWHEPLLWVSGILIAGAIGCTVFLAVRILNVSEEAAPPYMIREGNDDFPYLLRADATEYQIELFDQLIESRGRFEDNDTPATTQAYAQAVVKSFIVDFFTWSNKSDRADIGGLQFIAPSIRQHVRGLATDEFYLYLNQYLETFGPEGVLEVRGITIEETDLDAIWQIPLPPQEESEEGGLDDVQEAMYEELEVIRIRASWQYAPTAITLQEEFQQEGVFYLIRERGHLRIQALFEIENGGDLYVH